MKLQTRLIQTKHTRNEEDLVPPIHTSVLFAMDEPNSDTGSQYGRIHNRTRDALTRALMDIHSAGFGMVTSSGSAAIVAVCLSVMGKDTAVLHHTEYYEGTRRIFTEILRPFGVRSIPCDFTDPSTVSSIMDKEKPFILWIESPTNPTLRVFDIRALSTCAHRHSAIAVVDTTMCSGLVQQPLDHGADIVVESLTKGMNGHSDALGGFIGTNNEGLGIRIRSVVETTGPTLDPWQSFLIHRGISTAHVRLKAQQRTATQIAKWLQHEPHIAHVMTPGSNNPHEQKTAKHQMTGKGQVVSFTLKPSCNASAFAKSVRLIRISHSFGGVETIIQQPKTMMDMRHVPDAQKPDERLFRLSVGLEHPEDIIADLKQALEQSSTHMI